MYARVQMVVFAHKPLPLQIKSKNTNTRTHARTHTHAHAYTHTHTRTRIHDKQKDEATGKGRKFRPPCQARERETSGKETSGPKQQPQTEQDRGPQPLNTGRKERG